MAWQSYDYVWQSYDWHGNHKIGNPMILIPMIGNPMLFNFLLLVNDTVWWFRLDFLTPKFYQI